MSRSLETLMRAKGFPVAVVYGPEIATRTAGANSGVVVVERDRQANDTIAAPQGFERNPRKLFTWERSAKATVLVRSQLPGATMGDHERECERFVMGLIAALRTWGTSERVGVIRFGEMGMLTDEERNHFAGIPSAGCAYLVRFRVPTGLPDLSYTPESAGTAGAPLPTGQATGVSNTTRLGLVGAEEDPGCGPLPT